MASLKRARKMAYVYFITPIEVSRRRMIAIRRGHVPQDMDDRWQAVFHGGAGNGDTYEDTAYVSLHRSWTGIEIFRVYFNKDEDGKYRLHKFSYNTNKSQFKPRDSDDIADEILLALESTFPKKH
jgi:hypothetical protein